MVKKLSKTNISLLIITLCAIICCGFIAIDNFSANKVPTAHAESSAILNAGYDLFNSMNYEIENLIITNNFDKSTATGTPIDCSEDQDGSINAYKVNNGDGTYNCVIYADVDKIYAPEYCDYLFACNTETLKNVKTITFENNCFDTSRATGMNEMFAFYEFLTEINGISNWDTSNVKSMLGLFSFCPALSKLEISDWNTSSVEDMNSMFGGLESITSLDISKWDTSNVTDMGHMFDGCVNLKNLNLSNFNTSKVTKMKQMFAGCASLEVLDLSNFDFSAITSDDDVQGMFGFNDAYILALADSFGEDGAALKSSYQQAINNNSKADRIQVLASALQGLGQDEATANEMATILLNTNIQTIYAPTSLNSRNICLPFNNNAQYVYYNGDSEETIDFLVERGQAEELAIYVQGETPLAKPETSAPSVTPETGFVDEQLLPALAIGFMSIVAVMAVVNKKEKI